ncbi:hypothetical protein [Wenyingzhuangia sp. 2_MG-2023]|uniref:hypothetical protein n=1 Tax=Wenyingzhuangia sp. 2_MG-2023 TaxID=3062639 RepID=UPI0026E1CFA0|nr:hypothetical protein [Wenyingzhuangia sp. 2_MG-2023]MDO6738054.1 hypothetical protein [Wenyingzhuangia sp. 2_MG-2023]MDO6802592.1 hypothetical protein [Wenyingzhuangia sp. 1_MG-2023]
MSNPFKEIQENHEPSKELRKKVLSDVDMLKLTLDLADLYLIKYPKILSTLFKNKK